MTAIAPACPVSRSQPTQKPSQPSHVEVAAIPLAHDLRSAINALNIMSSVVQQVTRGAPQVNNVYPLTAGGVPAPAKDPSPEYERLIWEESSRGYVEQKLINPDDREQFIWIKTIGDVIWREKSTGHQLFYWGA
jgi:hypothetical protein